MKLRKASIFALLLVAGISILSRVAYAGNVKMAIKTASNTWHECDVQGTFWTD